jgi:hypothetical protein
VCPGLDPGLTRRYQRGKGHSRWQPAAACRRPGVFPVGSAQGERLGSSQQLGPRATASRCQGPCNYRAPPLLRLWHLAGCPVTIDARGCHKDSAQTLIAPGPAAVRALNAPQGSTTMSPAFWQTSTPRVRSLRHGTPTTQWRWTMAMWRPAPLGSPPTVTGGEPRLHGRRSPAVAWSQRVVPSPTRWRLHPIFPSPRGPPTLHGWPQPCGAMGTLPRVDRGCWLSRFVRTSAAFAPHRGHKILRSYVTSRSIFSDVNPTTTVASKPDGNARRGTTSPSGAC